MKQKFFFLLTTAMLLFTACSSDDNDNNNSASIPEQADMPVKTNEMKVYAHFMIWFETDTSNPNNKGKWGWHWTMNTSLNPANGEIASWYHPLTGPYASGDEDMLEYQCLLMKYSGIDGVIVDWYGAHADDQTAQHTTNAEKLLKAVEKTGLEIAVCYEDNHLDADDITTARTDMTYLAKRFFKSENYTKVDGQPLLLDFGPQKLTQPHQWTRTFQILRTHPFFVVLNGNSSKCNNTEELNASGEFAWVNAMPETWYQQEAAQSQYIIGGAMPGFKDYYKAGGVGDGYTTYDSEDGKLFERQLNAAKNANLKDVQISTWNDYGEGTVIEPTKENGYKYLTILQNFTGVKYGQQELKTILQWYTLREKYKGNTEKKLILDQAFDYLNKLMPDKAKEIMNGL